MLIMRVAFSCQRERLKVMEVATFLLIKLRDTHVNDTQGEDFFCIHT